MDYLAVHYSLISMDIFHRDRIGLEVVRSRFEIMFRTF